MEKELKILKFFVILLLLYQLPQSDPKFLWEKRTGGSDGVDEVRSVIQTYDSGFVFAGTKYYKQENSLELDNWIIKTNNNGNILWSKIFGGDLKEHAYSIQQADDGGFLILGETNSIGEGYQDIMLIKTDSNGDSLWTKTFGGKQRDIGYSIKKTDDGGYIIAGETKSFGLDETDIWLLKIDSKGDTLWTKTYGGDKTDVAFDVYPTNNGGYIIAGQKGNRYRDAWVLLTDSIGDTLWTKEFGNATQDDAALSIQQTIDGGFIVAGSFYNSAWVCKTDSNGETIWSKLLEGSEANSIVQTNEGDFFVVGRIHFEGNYRTDLWAAKLDNNGDSLWSQHYGDDWDDVANSVQQTYNGGFIIAGKYTVADSRTQAYIIRLGPDNDPIINTSSTDSENKFCLYLNNSILNVSYSLSGPSFVKLDIYNLAGKLIKRTVNTISSEGDYALKFNVSDLSRGIYVTDFQYEGYSIVKKFTTY